MKKTAHDPKCPVGKKTATQITREESLEMQLDNSELQRLDATFAALQSQVKQVQADFAARQKKAQTFRNQIWTDYGVPLEGGEIDPITMAIKRSPVALAPAPAAPEPPKA